MSDTKNKNQKYKQNTPLYTQTHTMRPNQVLEPRKAVSAVRWNPRRDSEVAVAFWHWAEVTHARTHAR